jgi:homoaconitase/3-isopropylmalate dehydratase large subunit
VILLLPAYLKANLLKNCAIEIFNNCVARLTRYQRITISSIAAEMNMGDAVEN